MLRDGRWQAVAERWSGLCEWVRGSLRSRTGAGELAPSDPELFIKNIDMQRQGRVLSIVRTDTGCGEVRWEVWADGE